MNNIKVLDLNEAIKLIKKHNIPFVKSVEIKNEKELNKVKLKYPIVLKAVSPKIIHKTEFNAVRLNLQNKKQALKAFKALKKLPAFEKAIAQEMISGHELIVGIKQDEIFGHALLLGFGGIYTEILKDFSIRILPIKKKDALQMISELKMFPLLKGFRGKKKANIKALVSFLLKASKMIEKEKWVKELDFNPVIVNERKALAVDVRVIK